LRRILLPWLLLIGAILAAAACSSGSGEKGNSSPTPTVSGLESSPGPGVTSDRILLGMTNDLTSTGKTPYGAITLAIQAYFKSLNEEGGVCGRTLELMTEDDAYSAPVALEKTKKLVEQDGVLAMIGGIGTEQHQQVAAYLNDPNADGNTADGIPDLFVSSGWAGFFDASRYPWTVQFIPAFAMDGAILGEYIKANLAGKKTGVLYRDDDFGREYFAGVAASLGGADKIVPQPFPPDTADLAAQVGALKDGGVEVVVVAATPEVAATAITAAVAGGYAPQWLMGYSIPPSALASRVGGGMSADQLVTGFRLLNGTLSTQYLMSAVEDEAKPEMVEHTRIMETYRGPPVSSLSVYGQALAETVAWTISRTCGNLTREGLMKAAETTTGFRPSLMLPGISINLSDTDHRSIDALQFVEIRESGEVAPVGDVVSLEASPTPAPAGDSATPGG
jgi:ABC-type branched-subunit amino acid transport system substrate-binding protein